MKIEKLLKWVVAFEFISLAIGLSVFFLFKPPKEEISEIIEEPLEVITEVEPERTPEDWVDLIKEVAYDKYKVKVNSETALDYYFYSKIWGNTYDIPIETVLAMIGRECHFIPNLCNYKNSNGSKDYGVLMVNDVGLTDYNDANWENPVSASEVQNNICTGIMVGCWNYNNKKRILAIYEIETTEENILSAYNAGQGKVRKGTIPNSTKNYVSDIQTLKQLFF